MEHPHLLLSVVPVYLTSLNDSNYIRLYAGARLNSEWLRMWKETTAASCKGQEELTNIRKIVNYGRRFPGPPWDCVRAVCGDCKPSDSFQKVHAVDRKTVLFGWINCLQSPPSFICFLSRFTSTYLLCLTSTIPGRPRSLFHALF